MDQIAEYFLSMWGYWLAGGIVMGAGFLMVRASRSATDEGSRKTMRWVGFPLIGCGGILFMVPFVAITGLLLIGGGVVMFCGQSAGC